MTCPSGKLKTDFTSHGLSDTTFFARCFESESFWNSDTAYFFPFQLEPVLIVFRCLINKCLSFSEVVPLLFQVINAQDSRSRENVNATENAVSAVAKICKYNRGNIALNEVIPAFIAALPIIEDKEEAPHVYGYLCDVIEG